MDHAGYTVITVITLSYVVFALQVFFQTNWKKANRKSTIALGSLIVVFLFCAMAGYVTSLLPSDYHLFREVLHWILAAASITLVVTNQAKVVARLLDGE